jgi:U32 family peptidase
MKITSPINKLEEVELLINAGANEFYLGYINPQISGADASNMLNRRSYRDASVSSKKDLEEITMSSHDKGVPVFVTFNEHSYSEIQKPTIMNLISDIIDVKADAIIVGDPGLMLFIREQGIDINMICSVAGGVFNSKTSDFYKSLGVSRMILPRWLRTDEIKALIEKSPDVEYEAFILNARCHFSDCYCNFFHPTKSNQFLCKNVTSLEFLDSSGDIIDNENINQQITEYRQWNRFCPESDYAEKEHCGVCAIPYLKDAGVTALKIVGRARPTEEKIKNIILLRECINLIGEGDNESFKHKVKKLVGDACGKPYSCYYPDVL